MAKIKGTKNGDILEGTSGNDIITGLQGDDTINGGAGDDRVVAGSGDDTIIADGGHDTINAGGGNDTVIIKGDASASIRGGAGLDTVRIQAGALGSTILKSSGESFTRHNRIRSSTGPIVVDHHNPAIKLVLKSQEIPGCIIDGGSGVNVISTSTLSRSFARACRRAGPQGSQTRKEGKPRR